MIPRGIYVSYDFLIVVVVMLVVIAYYILTSEKREKRIEDEKDFYQGKYNEMSKATDELRENIAEICKSSLEQKKNNSLLLEKVNYLYENIAQIFTKINEI